jgi:hypothetical protein
MKNKGEDKIEHATKYEEKTGGGESLVKSSKILSMRV